jgi:galactokinase
MVQVRLFSANLKDDWGKFTKNRDAAYERASDWAAAIPSNRRYNHSSV